MIAFVQQQFMTSGPNSGRIVQGSGLPQLRPGQQPLQAWPSGQVAITVPMVPHPPATNARTRPASAGSRIPSVDRNSPVSGRIQGASPTGCEFDTSS